MHHTATYVFRDGAPAADEIGNLMSFGVTPKDRQLRDIDDAEFGGDVGSPPSSAEVVTATTTAKRSCLCHPHDGKKSRFTKTDVRITMTLDTSKLSPRVVQLPPAPHKILACPEHCGFSI